VKFTVTLNVSPLTTSAGRVLLGLASCAKAVPAGTTAANIKTARVTSTLATFILFVPNRELSTFAYLQQANQTQS
jgi:hypothetical protein